jgi:hypothetical protein
MASLSQVVSEIAHSLGQPNNKALRENVRLLIIQTRNELIRRSYENHGYVDKGLTQRFRVTLTDVTDGDITLPEGYEDIPIDMIKRTTQKVPRPIRLTNNLPFDRVSSVGYKTSREFPYIKETSARFRSFVPGLCGMPSYDYINEYIYLFPNDNDSIDINQIVIEGAFEKPNLVSLKNGTLTEDEMWLDNNEYLLSEDMIGTIKDIIYKRDLLQTPRQTDEIPNSIKF